ncbi:hypothetical protein HPB49_023160 [Dermacentor silvarum]|uniref:Uncharacterized protein n=1 Tax=Dermacentor silvarum TaxID=543639 RepID=A0ACB8C647_DERSI|nr:hypothetical protein HPB49_023160 [Dermacentor silvarum]
MIGVKLQADDSGDANSHDAATYETAIRDAKSSTTIEMATRAALLAAIFLAVMLIAMADDAFVKKQTTEGMVRGNVIRALGKTVEEYRGIPFAEPPVGKLRFRPPVPKRPWEGTMDATAGNTACPQVGFT